MATSVWLMGLYLGYFLSSAGGSATFDLLGFSWSCTIQAAIMAASVRGDVRNSDRFGWNNLQNKTRPRMRDCKLKCL